MTGNTKDDATTLTATATAQRSGSKRGPSIADVAAAAGVSAQTVSRVSNGHTNVQEATRHKVEDAMRQLGYRPNRAARALKSGRYVTIGIIMFTLSSVGNVKTLDAIAQAASEAGYSISLIPMPDPASRKFPAAYTRLREHQVDGLIIIFDAHLSDRADLSLPTDLPTVVIDSTPGHGYTVVDTDQAGGARQATELLLGLGHATVWHIGGPPTSFSASHRAAAWRETLSGAGIEAPPILYGDWSTDSGYRAGMTLAARDDVTAIFAANDHMALGAMRALHEMGRKIPQEVSIVGFDDLDESSSFWPPLTTVHQSFQTVGSLSVQLLLEQIMGNPAPSTQLVPTRLVVRESTSYPHH